MILKTSRLGQALACGLLISSPVFGQSTQQESIVNTTQILDTGVLFAIGAREAEQAIRGAFGWPTFQEGFVDKVYFRFDPDGYARFSNSPRLDEDVFEVICAESSTACIAKKNGVEIGLAPTGQIQIRLSGITPQDSFYVSDNNSELPLPPAILEPLDARLEALLATGGDLLIKREQETVNSISLSGFSAVITYLRWVAQNQDSRVFPRGWPVPAHATATQTSSLTQPGQWQTPNLQPQFAPTTFDQQLATGVNQTSNASNGQQITGQQQFQSNLANLNPQQPLSASGQAAFGAAVGQASIQSDQFSGNAAQNDLTQLQTTILQLRNELDALRSGAASIQPANQNASLDWGIAGAQNQPRAQEERIRDQSAPSSNQGSATLSRANESYSNFDHQHMTAILNRLIVVETKIQELEHSFHTAMTELQYRTAHISTSVPSGKDEQENGDIRPQPDGSMASEMSPLEKLLLDRLGEAETISEHAIAKLAEPEPKADINQEKLIRDLLQQLTEMEGSVSSSEVVSTEADVRKKTDIDPAVSELEGAEPEGFVTLSEYINNILKAEETPK